MPLPAVLAAKLSKRGLITNTSKSYEKDTHADYKGVLNCPNKSNVYHECTNWCQIHWKGLSAPETHYTRNIKKLLEKYPLPNNWTEIFDKGIGRYYYWDMETDMVSWLPPKHPKAVSTECAAKLRMKLHIPQSQKEGQSDKDVDRRREQRDRHHRERRDRENRDDDRRQKHEERDRSRRRFTRSDDIDPMDPAAYSDVPRGTWSDGLENNKSKADSTASGVLYQQRPYPAPGDVLSANKQKSKKK